MTDDLDVSALLALVAARDPAAADGLDRLAARLHALADELRAGAADGSRSLGGAADRVRMAVVGPDGTTKQTIDTGA